MSMLLRCLFGVAAVGVDSLRGAPRLARGLERRAVARGAVGAEAVDRLDVLFVVGRGASQFGKTSPQPSSSWHAVATHLCDRLPNFDARIVGTVAGGAAGAAPDVVVALGLTDAAALEAVLSGAPKKPAAVLADVGSCSEAVVKLAYAGSYRPGVLQDAWAAVVPWGQVAKGKRIANQGKTLLRRYSSEDAVFAALFALHGLVPGAVIDAVKTDINPSWEKGVIQNVKEFKAMADCCGPEIFAALSDPQTKSAIDLLNAVDLRDQVGSYRVIVSNETPQLEDFSLCILQQNNCFNADAKILEQPRVPALSQWRGEKLDLKASKQILVGHLDDVTSGVPAAERRPWSWKVVTGANPAYDAFPMQHQIFYPSSNSTGLWYDPVFCVETLEGKLVWTKRHYRCAPRKHWSGGEGAWTLTTLDNGIVSKEHWTIIDAADDLEWFVVHYSGAAKAAGQSYQGALLCSGDGAWPAKAAAGAGLLRIEAAFARCGLEMWELYGHGPPQSAKSFMWSEEYAAFASATPPPLQRIGDQTITKWRKQQRELARP
mmetsp:Transcript_2200/g.7860  ORF Transcript_2200/g.7860 Transcript_2200/m.7860 type:complete len:544 (+) Transcript_2200:76-1707(+)